MAEILQQRALVTALAETTFGTENPPSPSTDALLVDEPDFSVDINQVVRSFSRQSLSPLPNAAGRKVGQMTFAHEVRGTGTAGGTAPRVGRLLRACGYSETEITANGTTTNGRTDVTADAGNGGPATTWASGGANALIADASYRVRVTVGGISGTAEMRVTGGRSPDDQQTDASQARNAVFTETFCVENTTELGTITGAVVVDDATDPQNVDYDFTGLGGLTIGDVFEVTVLGIPFTVTVTVATPTGLGDDMVTAVAAHPAFGASNVAGVVTVTFAGDAASVVVTSGSTALTLDASGHTITPTWAGSQVLNDAFTAVTKPIGFEYDPISTGFPSLTIYMYFDGVLHKLTGARGTFTVEGTGGEIALFNFTFQGNFETVTDVALPAATFETQAAVQVELSQLHVNPDVDLAAAPTALTTAPNDCDTYEDQVNGTVSTLCAASFGLDQANEVNIRECINEADAFNGVVITGREPTGSMDPELELVATHNFWNILATADVLEWRVRVGTARGNIVRFESNSAQYVGLTYAERNGLRTLGVDLKFSGTAPNFSDDELQIAFN